jgi:D-alanine-D-alanine ligase
MLHKLPISKDKLFVWVFIPYKIQGEKLISEYYDFPGIREELADVFAELGLAWKWQPVTLENIHTVVEEVLASQSEYMPIVLNYCDGLDKIDEYPGLSVIKLLEAKRIIFTGADSDFEYRTISKIRMKRALIEAGVSTALYEVISDPDCVEGVCHRLGTPLIVKPAVQAGNSYGISLKSVVYKDQQIGEQAKYLLQGNHSGIQLPSDSILVEQFINGSEFTVFLIGSSQQPEKIKIYPPLERIFNSDLPETEQFLSYDSFQEKDEGNTSSQMEKPFLTYQLVVSKLSQRLCDLAKRAYCAVGGNGYGRVDIRMDQASQELFVLEVNANCGISSKPYSTFTDLVETTIGTILHLANIPFAQLMSEIIDEAFARDYQKLASVNKHENKT